MDLAATWKPPPAASYRCRGAGQEVRVRRHREPGDARWRPSVQEADVEHVVNKSPRQPSEHRWRGRPRCSIPAGRPSCSPPPTPAYRTSPARQPQREDPTSSTVGRGWRRGCGVSSSSASDRDDGGEWRRRLTREDGGEGEGCCAVDPEGDRYRRDIYTNFPRCSIFYCPSLQVFRFS